MKSNSTVSTTLLSSVLAFGLTGVATTCTAAEFSDGDIYFELNDTDGDLGIHGLVDGGPWRYLRVEDSNDEVILAIRAWGNMTQQGMTQLFFESAEPNFDDLSPPEFFARFPAGIYEILGLGHQGGLLENETLVRHVMPQAPGGVEVAGQPIAPTCKVDDPDYDPGLIPVVAADQRVVVSWDPVTASHPTIGEPGDIEVDQYQFFVSVDSEFGSTEYAFVLSADTTSIRIPNSILGLGDEFKIEVLVKEADGGNQSATESCFFIE